VRAEVRAEVRVEEKAKSSGSRSASRPAGPVVRRARSVPVAVIRPSAETESAVVSTAAAPPPTLPYYQPSDEKLLGLGRSEYATGIRRESYEARGVPPYIASVLADYVADSVPFTRALRVARTEYGNDPKITAAVRDAYEVNLERAIALQDWLTYQAPVTTEDMVVWRGTHTHRNTKPYYYSAITGWSQSAIQGLGFAGRGCCLYRLVIPRGTSAFSTQTDEFEILLGKHQFCLLGSTTYLVPDYFNSSTPPVTVYQLAIII
jgi:hypothetical protein